ncbi:hypothetical protein V6N13_109989 [Hibiscus sabdariffa]|uniref:Uncharacterized protein n=1 Tax=Hibiscus sabdariffa TaxID=183260 RepID=A0ABR2AGH1_9ROSI
MHCCYSSLAIFKDPSICFLIFKNYFNLLKLSPQLSNLGVFRNVSTYAFLNLHLERVLACAETGCKFSVDEGIPNMTIELNELCIKGYWNLYYAESIATKYMNHSTPVQNQEPQP